MKKKRSVWRFLQKILFILALLGCIGAVIYPMLSNYLYDIRQDKIITEYEEKVEHADTSALDAEREACYEYNRKISLTTSVVTDGQSQIEQIHASQIIEQEYDKRLNLSGNGIMGYLTIPKININLPVAHDTTTEVLDAGVGHIPESSLPVGGIGTHSVLTGHTGSTDKVVFTDLDQLVVGDHFYMSVLGEILIYEVDQILTVLPHQVNALMIEQDKDYMTLITCTPYGINSHRLLVRGHRVEITDSLLTELGLNADAEDEELKEAISNMIESEKDDHHSAFEANYYKSLLFASSAAIAIVLLYLVFLKLKRRRKKEVGDGQ